MAQKEPDWVIHITGADDVIEQPDELTALRRANALNKAVAADEHHEYDPFVVALVKDRSSEELYESTPTVRNGRAQQSVAT